MSEPPAQEHSGVSSGPARASGTPRQAQIRRGLSLVRLAPALAGGTLGFRLRSQRSRALLPGGEDGCRQASVAWLVPLCFFTNLGAVGPVTFLSSGDEASGA
ncbi:unnamed protein product [Prorocentrum cordatum]|uniref:Uncharacterized protein n=1 Tax=Prorocentrum cordatum TaxID=2364126 RepID=A0ABN9RVX7_9DINO|nr:unnamed protein product [Polarella glacialis]